MLKMTFLKHTSGLSYIKAAKNPFRLNHLEFFHFLTRPNVHLIGSSPESLLKPAIELCVHCLFMGIGIGLGSITLPYHSRKNIKQRLLENGNMGGKFVRNKLFT